VRVNDTDMEYRAFSFIGLAVHHIGALEPDMFLSDLRRRAGAAPPRFRQGA